MPCRESLRGSLRKSFRAYVLQCEFMRKALCFVLLTLSYRGAWADKRPVTLASVASSSRSGISVVWSPAGDKFIYREGESLQLVDCAGAKETELIRLAKLRSAAIKTPAPATFDWTNRRVTASSCSMT